MKAVAELLNKNVKLAHLFHVDLIPYNTSAVSDAFKSSKKSQIAKFGGFLKSQGIGVTIRMQFGSDLNAACGQLCVDS